MSLKLLRAATLRTALSRAEEHSTVSLDAPTTVAGRPAYQAVVTPRTSGTLVARVVVAVDSEVLDGTAPSPPEAHPARA